MTLTYLVLFAQIHILNMNMEVLSEMIVKILTQPQRTLGICFYRGKHSAEKQKLSATQKAEASQVLELGPSTYVASYGAH